MNRATNKFHCDLRHPTKKEMKMNKERMGVIDIRGGSAEERAIAVKVIDWCFESEVIIRSGIDIHMDIEANSDCWGSCVDSDDDMTSFDVTISNEQGIRDFVATIIHEMIHVNQYITNTWKGDGEKEAEERQYKLTDKLWKEGIL